MFKVVVSEDVEPSQNKYKQLEDQPNLYQHEDSKHDLNGMEAPSNLSEHEGEPNLNLSLELISPRLNFHFRLLPGNRTFAHQGRLSLLGPTVDIP